MRHLRPGGAARVRPAGGRGGLPRRRQVGGDALGGPGLHQAEIPPRDLDPALPGGGVGKGPHAALRGHAARHDSHLLCGPGRPEGRQRGEDAEVRRRPWHGPQVLPRRPGQQVPVVHHRRALEKVGQEGLPRGAHQRRGGKAVGGHPPDGARHRGQRPHGRVGGPRQGAESPLRKAQRPGFGLPPLPGAQRYGLQVLAHPGGPVARRRGHAARRHLLRPQHAHGRGVHLPHARPL